jgi:hypothetical protein
MEKLFYRKLYFEYQIKRPTNKTLILYAWYKIVVCACAASANDA